jgi:kynurenine formamidase
MARIIDLSHAIEHGSITYPGLPGPEITDHLSRAEAESAYGPGVTFHIARISMVANTGTYLDTPSHRFASGPDLATMPLETMVNLDGCRVTATATRAIGPETFAGLDVRGKAVLVSTGWSQHWGTPEYGGAAPFLTSDACAHLVEGGATLVGIDSVNIDDMADLSRPAHSMLLGGGIPIVEHLHRLGDLPADGFQFFAAPPAIAGMGTFPVRAFALVEDGSSLSHRAM